MKQTILNLTQTKFAHGLFVTIAGAVSTAAYNALQSGHLPQSWADIKPIVILGLSAGLGYIIKNMALGSSNITPDKVS